MQTICDGTQEITDTVEAPEVAFTGDTSADFITHPGNEDVLRARLLIMVWPLKLLHLNAQSWGSSLWTWPELSHKRHLLHVVADHYALG